MHRLSSSGLVFLSLSGCCDDGAEPCGSLNAGTFLTNPKITVFYRMPYFTAWFWLYWTERRSGAGESRIRSFGYRTLAFVWRDSRSRRLTKGWSWPNKGRGVTAELTCSDSVGEVGRTARWVLIPLRKPVTCNMSRKLRCCHSICCRIMWKHRTVSWVQGS